MDAAASSTVAEPEVMILEDVAPEAQDALHAGTRVRQPQNVKVSEVDAEPLALGDAPPSSAWRARIDDAGEDFLAPILGVADTTPARHSCLQSLLRSPRSLQLH